MTKGIVIVSLILSCTGWIGLVLGVVIIGYAVVAHRKGWRSLLRPLEPNAATLKATFYAALLGVGCCLFGVAGLAAQADRQRKQDALVQNAANEAQAKERERQSIVERANASLPDLLGKWESRLAGLESTPPKADNIASLLQTGQALASEITDIGSKATDAAGIAHCDTLAERTRKLVSTFATSKAIADDLVALANATDEAGALLKQKAWMEAEDASNRGLAKLTTLERRSTDELAPFLPQGFKLSAKRSALDQIAKTAKAPAARQRKDIAIQDAYATLCGPKPQAGGWDGEVAGLESALRRTAHDPDSIDVENCTDAVLTQKRCWRFTCDVRGKNMFGANVLNVRTFYYAKMTGFESD